MKNIDWNTYGTITSCEGKITQAAIDENQCVLGGEYIIADKTRRHMVLKEGESEFKVSPKDVTENDEPQLIKDIKITPGEYVKFTKDSDTFPKLMHDEKAWVHYDMTYWCEQIKGGIAYVHEKGLAKEEVILVPAKFFKTDSRLRGQQPKELKQSNKPTYNDIKTTFEVQGEQSPEMKEWSKQVNKDFKEKQEQQAQQILENAVEVLEATKNEAIDQVTAGTKRSTLEIAVRALAAYVEYETSCKEKYEPVRMIFRENEDD